MFFSSHRKTEPEEDSLIDTGKMFQSLALLYSIGSERMEQSNHENKLVLSCLGSHIQMRVIEVDKCLQFSEIPSLQ